MIAFHIPRDLWADLGTYVCWHYRSSPKRQRAVRNWFNAHYDKRADIRLSHHHISLARMPEKSFEAYCMYGPDGKMLISGHSAVLTYPHPDTNSVTVAGAWVHDHKNWDRWLQKLYRDVITCMKYRDRDTWDGDLYAQYEKALVRTAKKTVLDWGDVHGSANFGLLNFPSVYVQNYIKNLQEALSDPCLPGSKTNSLRLVEKGEISELRIATLNPENADWHHEGVLEPLPNVSCWSKSILHQFAGNTTGVLLEDREENPVTATLPPYATVSMVANYIRGEDRGEYDGIQHWAEPDDNGRANIYIQTEPDIIPNEPSGWVMSPPLEVCDR